MNLETVIQEKVHALPIGKQAKVLAFVEDLEDEEFDEHEMPNDKMDDAAVISKRYSFIGIGQSKSGDISERAEEILAQEVKRRSGWSMKDELVD